jgi:hypothetical protein
MRSLSEEAKAASAGDSLIERCKTYHNNELLCAEQLETRGTASLCPRVLR